MKVRAGFVSNSSSTGFYFILNGDKERLVALIRAYSTYFKSPVSADELAEQIERIGVTFEPLSKILDYEEKSLEKYERAWSEAVTVKDTRALESTTREKTHHSFRVDVLQHAAGRGLNNVARISFGDNCGQIEGRIGTAIYRNGLPLIEGDDIVVIMED